MRNPTASLPGRSARGPLMAQLIQEKRAAGYGYVPQSERLNDLDRFLFQEGLTRIELPKDLAQRWCAKRDHESAKTHRFRIYVVRQLAEFLGHRGYPAWTPDSKLTTIPAYDFVPHIFSVEEVRKLFAAVDALDHGAWSLRHTFAVHCLVRWYRRGDDLNARLPVLATSLGHQGLDGTHRYLRLTAEIFPELAARLQDRFGNLIPEGEEP
jgi:site-specific recombinase XerD